jgi:glutamine synthetase
MLCNIEAVTLHMLAKKDILHAAMAYSSELSQAALAKRAFVPDADCSYERDTVLILSKYCAALYRIVTELSEGINTANEKSDSLDKAHYFKDSVLTKMDELRVISDEVESIVPSKHWSFPTYGDLLFSIR